MNTMNMPGFTAEDSLYISRTQYQMTATKFLAAKADIQPQLRRRPWPGPGNCDPSCVCVTCEGCPCCQSLCPWPQPMDEAIF
jgi:hypothetical protein